MFLTRSLGYLWKGSRELSASCSFSQSECSILSLARNPSSWRQIEQEGRFSSFDFSYCIPQKDYF